MGPCKGGVALLCPLAGSMDGIRRLSRVADTTPQQGGYSCQGALSALERPS